MLLTGRATAQVPGPPAAAGPGADAGPLSLALVLSQSPIPSGVITTENPSGSLARSATGPDLPPVSWPDVLTRLTARHPDYAADWQDEVLVIERRQSACVRATSEAAVGPATLEGDAARLLVLLGWMASGDPAPIHGGVISSRETGSTTAMPAPRTLRLVLPAATPLRDALNRLVRENRNGVWIVWQHRRPDGGTGCRLVAYYSGGLIAASTSDFAVVP